MIKGKSPEEIRKTFNIKNDFTPAEEEQVLNNLANNPLYKPLPERGLILEIIIRKEENAGTFSKVRFLQRQIKFVVWMFSKWMIVKYYAW